MFANFLKMFVIPSTNEQLRVTLFTTILWIKT